MNGQQNSTDGLAILLQKRAELDKTLAERLKKSILQEAIEGRLVPQDPNDEPVSVLLDKIRKEKARLVKEGKLKKKDLEETPISEDDKPFEIPESWEWTRLGDHLSATSGLAYKKDDLSTYSSEYVRVLRGGNISFGSWCKKDDDVLIGKQFVNDELILKRGTYISPAVTSLEHMGKTALIKEDQTNVVAGGFVLMMCPHYSNEHYWEYLNLFFQSGFYRERCKSITNKSGQAFYNISRTKLLESLIPLPPLAEQCRIVAKIEELLPKVEEYGKAQEALDKLNSELPERLKKSILQEAITGHLVPQDPNDEPASVLLDKIRKEKARLVKEGKLKKKDLEETPISEDDKPFEIPESWEWVRLQDITVYISRGKSPVYSELRKYPVVAQKCNQWSGFSLEKAKFADPSTIDKYAEERLLIDGDLLWNSTGLGTLGRMAIYDSSVNEYGWAVADSHVTVIRTLPEFCSYKFLFYFFTSHHVQNVIEDKSDGSTKQKELAQETVRKYEIPLPPLSEQHRIVAKIEDLMKEIDKLKA